MSCSSCNKNEKQINKLGRCKFCIYTNLFSAIISWIFYLIFYFFYPTKIPLSISLIFASFFSAFFTIHMFAFFIIQIKKKDKLIKT